MTSCNIIIFGESGVGKSSVVNLIAGKDVAVISSNAEGCTPKSTAYDIAVSNTKYRLYDTAGLDEITTVSPKDALMNLYKLVLSLREGVSLLVYVIRGPRVKESTRNNYELFDDIICDKKVPILLVVTGLESERSMEGWWDENSGIFYRHNMIFVDQACITATKGKERNDGTFVYQQEYEESKEKVQRCLYQNVLPVPWRMDPAQWPILLAKRGWNFFARVLHLPLLPYSDVLCEALMRFGRYPKREAVALANEVVKEFDGSF